MRILCVATKCPWPPCDGGRLVLSLTLQGLLEAGHDVTVVAPDDSATLPSVAVPQDLTLHRVASHRRGWVNASLRALGSRRAITLARHDQPRMRSAVADCIACWRPHLVHAEQLQAMSSCGPALTDRVPIVLRMQNIESALWEQMPSTRIPTALARWEARRLRAAEGLALKQAAATITLTRHDADALASHHARVDERARIACIEPAFPAIAPAGAPVEGDPALALSGSRWWPNVQGRGWFLETVWPLLHAELPLSRLHVYGGDARSTIAGVQWHDAPAQSQTAFPRGAIAIVPLLAAAGVRMRILEAWARGLPVIATSVAAGGLDIAGGRELLVADSPQEFLDAVLQASRDAVLRRRLIDGGRAYLRQYHDPQRQTQALLGRYISAVPLDQMHESNDDV